MKSISASLFAGISSCVLAGLSPPTADAQTETVLYSFCSQANCADGEEPNVALVNAKDTLYGTTDYGGANGGGTIYSFNPTTGTETVLYSFCSQPNCADGRDSKASLIVVKGKLYGVTQEGGANGGGTVFSFNLKSGKEKILYSLCSLANCADGAAPYNALIEDNGMLYGTTANGGGFCNASCGVVYAVDEKTGAETVLHSFGNGDDGAEPFDSLLYESGTLYGTTSIGGTYGLGTLFSLSISSGAEQVLHSFAGVPDGMGPATQPIEVGGKLYGTTTLGGTGTCVHNVGCGTVYSYDLTTNEESVVYSFCSQLNCSDGFFPVSSLLEVKGMLYSTTLGGGSGNCEYYYSSGCGTIFTLDPNSGAESVAYSFCNQALCADGDQPPANVINVKGTLYGVAFAGGANNEGVVFSYMP